MLVLNLSFTMNPLAIPSCFYKRETFYVVARIKVNAVRCSSLATFYCIHSLVEKANQLGSEIFTHEADEWKQWQGEPEPSKKLMDLLLRLVFLVDIQGLAQLDETVVNYQVTSRCTEHSVE
ncbi:hypothetical protein QL285_058184 [Trifolium repens]|nr:hypothetical protein QL285_058184 [Trifolium repens]